MSHQLTLNNFYKITSKNIDNPMEENKKRYSLSLLKSSPSKISKLKVGDVQNVIDLTSPVKDIEDTRSNSSNETIIYSPKTPTKSPKSNLHSPESTPSTPKYFSPYRKRSITIKTPPKVKKNLNKIYSSYDTQLEVAGDGLDDKTIYLLTIIYKYLNEKSLTCLLDEHSQLLLSNCLNLVKPGLRLVCRLYWRKEGWYRLEQIKQILTMDKKYSIDDSVFWLTIESLLQNGLLVDSKSQGHMSFDELVEVLKAEELKLICKDLKIKVTTKNKAIKSLQDFRNRKSNISSYFKGGKSDNEMRLLKIVKEKVGQCFKLTDLAYRTLNELYILMYLGIDQNILREKKLELTLLYDKINRETYPIDKEMDIDNAGVVFRNRLEFQRYLEANEMYVTFLNTTELHEKTKIIKDAYSNYNIISKEDMKSYISLPEWLLRFTPPYLYIKIMDAGIVELKKEKQKIQLAVDILTLLITQGSFRQHKKGEWYAEKALIYDKFMMEPDTAARVLLEGFQNANLSNSTKDCMRPRANKLANRQTNRVKEENTRELLLMYGNNEDILEKCINSKHIYKHPKEAFGRGKVKFETKTKDGLSVLEAEEFCLMQYLDEGKYTHGEHWEGRILITLFFLLFWNIIYKNLRGVRGIFLTYYQKHPLDMYCDSFYANRKNLIDDRLKEIEEASEDEIIDMMKQVWDTRPESEMSYISRNMGWENVSDVARCLGARGLSAVCKRLAADYRYTHSGVPDLTLWNEHTKQIMFVEVKTDSDKPSLKQLQWMHYMKQNGIEVEFCYVGVNTSRCKARLRETTN